MEMSPNAGKKKKNLNQVFLRFAGHTWVDAGATASAAVVLFSHNYLPPDRERKRVRKPQRAGTVV